MEDYGPHEHSLQEGSPLIPEAEDEIGTTDSHHEDLGNVKYKCVKNCFMISLIFYCNFTAINSMSGLASSLNHETVVSMSVYAFTSIIGSYISPVLVPKVGGKILMFMCLVTSMAYILMEFYPRYYTLVPLSVFSGVFSGVAWTVQMMYCTNTAIVYARVTNRPIETIIEYSYGIFFVFFSLTIVTGNLISSLVLGTFSNTTVPDVNNTALCCAKFCPEYADDETIIRRPTQSSVSVLILIYAGFLAVGILLVLFGLDTLRVFTDITQGKEYTQKTLKDELLSPLKVFINPNMLLLVLLYMYSGIEQNVIGSDYNEAYITCVLGVSFVGFSMMSYGVASAVGSLSSGLLGPIVSRPAVIATCLLLLLAAHLFLLYWTFSSDHLAFFFIPPIMFGFSDGALRTQINSLVGLLFRNDQEAAYSVINMLTVFGFGVVFAYNTAFCILVKLYISMTLLSLSLVLYFTFHYRTGRHVAGL